MASRSSQETNNEAYVNEYCYKVSSRPKVPVPAGDGAPISFAGEIPKPKDVEEYLIAQAIKIAEGDQTIAAQLLGISHSVLSRRLRNEP